MKLKVLATTILMTPSLTGFVLLGKETARLPVTPEAPSIEFHWSSDGKVPTLTQKGKFRDGTFADMADGELTPILIQEAMDQWNHVRGSYLRMTLSIGSGDLTTDTKDGVNNIVVRDTGNAAEAAHANPYREESEHIISDCDITMNDTKTSVTNFLETVTHELGHCVGLGHPHTNYGSIMSYSRGGSSYRLSADDKSGAIFLYPDPSIVSGEPSELVACGSIGQLHAQKGSPRLPFLVVIVLPVLSLMSLQTWTRSRQKI